MNRERSYCRSKVFTNQFFHNLGIRNRELTYSQCYTKCSIYFLHFGIGKHGFLDANQLIAENSTVVLYSFVHAYLDLSGEAVVIGVNGSANSGREILINKSLSGNNKENSVFLWVIFGTLINPVEAAMFHNLMSWYSKTSSASALSSSAYSLKSSISLVTPPVAAIGLEKTVCKAVDRERLSEGEHHKFIETIRGFPFAESP
jgi:hypothetical protein